MVHFSDAQLQIVRTIAAPVPYARRGVFLRHLARLIGDGDMPAMARSTAPHWLRAKS